MVLQHDGKRANRPRESASPHSASRAAEKNVVFTTTRYILFAHKQSDVGCLDFVLAPLPWALPGGEPRIYVQLLSCFILWARLFVLAPLSEPLRGVGTIRPLGSRCRRFGRDPCSVPRVASPLNLYTWYHEP